MSDLTPMDFHVHGRLRKTVSLTPSLNKASAFKIHMTPRSRNFIECMEVLDECTSALALKDILNELCVMVLLLQLLLQ